MPWRHVLFDTIYRIGRPIWDTPTPPEIIDVVEGAHALAPGRALDLGCGTSPNVAYLAQHGWDAIGVDISPTAIKKVKKNAEGIAGAHFVVADVTKLTGSGINGPFDLVIDNGCYHTLSEDGKEAYAPSGRRHESRRAVNDVGGNKGRRQRDPRAIPRPLRY